MLRSVVGALVAAAMLVGCAHRFETRTFDATLWKVGDRAVKGVIYYEPQLVKVTYSFTIRLDEKGMIVGSAKDNTCVPVVHKQDIVVYPDYNRPRALIYKPSWFASGKFGVTLKDGLLGGINVESTPQLPQILEAAPKALEPFGIVTPTLCNAAPEITSTERIRIQ